MTAGLTDGGLLLLRAVVGLLVIGHAVQKSLGWLGGEGLTATAAVFDRVGYRPGRAMVVLASVTEVAASMLLIAGFVTPVAGAVLVGVMLVACSVHWRFGIWAAQRGFELPLTFGVVAGALALTGGGSLSVDGLLSMDHPGWLAPTSLLAACIGAFGLIGLRRLRLRSEARAQTSVAG
jgi:putative oxidoreductase